MHKQPAKRGHSINAASLAVAQNIGHSACLRRRLAGPASRMIQLVLPDLLFGLKLEPPTLADALASGYQQWAAQVKYTHKQTYG